MRVAVLLSVLAGCDRVLGLAPIGPTGQGPSVTGRIGQEYPQYDAKGQPTLARYTPRSAALSVVLDDDTSPGVVYHDDGTFEFPVAYAGQRYRLDVSAGDFDQSYELAVPTLDLVARTASRPAELRDPVTQQTPITLDLSGGTPVGGIAVFSSSGIASSQLTFYTGAGPFTLDWRTMPGLGSPIALLDSTDYNDRLYVVDLQPASGYARIAQAFTTTVDLADGVGQTVPVAFEAAPADDCVNVKTQTSELYALLSQQLGVTGGDAGWGIRAVPVREVPPALGFQLVIAGGPNPQADVDQSVMFSRGPYAGYTYVAEIEINARRALALPGAKEIEVLTSGKAWFELPAAPTCPTDIAPLTSLVTAIPGEPFVDDVQIASDGTAVPAPATPGKVTLRWPYKTSGFADASAVQLYELRSLSGLTALHRVDSVMTTTNTVAFDAALFTQGHSYAVAISTLAGIPRAIDGDFATTSYPSAVMTTWSHSFTVQ